MERLFIITGFLLGLGKPIAAVRDANCARSRYCRHASGRTLLHAGCRAGDRIRAGERMQHS